jgi:Glycosyl transferase 4-like domain
MINVLFLAYEFPPLSRGGVHRSLAFVKWLPQYGINPIVITLDRSSYTDVFNESMVDESLGKKIREEATIIEIKSEKLPRQSKVEEFASIYFSIYGNEVKRWRQNYFGALPDIIEKYKPAAVFATAPPFSIYPLALRTSKMYSLPLLLDFRDAWSQWRTVPFGTRAHYWANLAMEKKCLKQADAIVVTSLETMKDLQRLHVGVNCSKFHYVPNGYEGKIEEWSPLDITREEFTIGYVGSFYYSPEAREQMLVPWWKKRGHRMLQYIPQRQDWLYRSPYFFFKTLHHLNTINPNLANKIRVKFVGKRPAWLADMISNFDLTGKVELMGEVAHSEAVEFQRKCDLLLITSAKRIGGKDYSVAGKTFEYIQAQKPILAFVCEGAQKDLLQKTGLALICEPDEVTESAQKIIDLVTGKISLQPNWEFNALLSREKLTEQLAGIIRKALEKQVRSVEN